MTDADAGAEYLASIFGTEKDKYVNSVNINIQWLLFVTRFEILRETKSLILSQT